MGDRSVAMNALVTGGGGFLGGAIVAQLRARGDSVRSFSRGDYPALREQGVETFRGDLDNAGEVEAAVDGCDVVFHAGATPGVWGKYTDYYRTNVVGTQNVIDACRRKGVRRLVFTSSPSVAFYGSDQEGLDESTPYPKRFLSHYPRTKAMAEALVLKTNDAELSTVALRPHLIWGPGDTQLVPRVVERAQAGRLRFLGDGRQKVDTVYIDNAAEAHLLASDKLAPDAACAGKVYYITNDEPWALADIINGILKAADVAPVDRYIPSGVAYCAGAILELVYGILGRTEEPMMTRFVARQLATAHWYDISAAKRDLGYAPSVSIEQGLARLAEHFVARASRP